MSDPTYTVDVPVGDFLVLVPRLFLGTGEAGSVLPLQVQSLVRCFATLGAYPVDFGEDHGCHVELWLSSAPTVEEAKRMAEHFIKAGGYV